MNSCTSNYYCCFEKTQSDIFPYQTKPLKSPSNLASSQLLKTYDSRILDDTKENPFIVTNTKINLEDTVMMVQNHRINNSVNFLNSTKSHTPNLRSLKTSQMNLHLSSSTKPFQEINSIVNEEQNLEQQRRQNKKHDRSQKQSCTSQDIKTLFKQTKQASQTFENKKNQNQNHKLYQFVSQHQKSNLNKKRQKQYKNLSSQSSLIRQQYKELSNSYSSNNYISIVSQKSMNPSRDRNHYSSISSSNSQLIQNQNTQSKQKLKKIANVHSQYLTKNLNQNSISDKPVKKTKNYHRHNISTIQLKQQSSLSNFHMKNSCFLNKSKHSQSLDRDNPFTHLPQCNISQNDNFSQNQDYYQFQTIDVRRTVNLKSTDKDINNLLPESSHYDNSAYQDKYHSTQQPKRLESYSKSKIFFTRCDGRGQDDYQEQEVHDFDSHHQAQENILQEDNIPIRNRDSILSNLKSFSTNQEFTEESLDSSNSEENKDQQGIKTQNENKHKFKGNYNSRNNDKMNCIIRVSSETTVKHFQSLDTKLSAIREAHNTIAIQELVIKKKKVIQDKLKSTYGNKVSQIQREMQQNIVQDQDQKENIIKQERQSVIERQIKPIKDFEFILTQFSNNQKQQNTLSIDDLGHALYLMKFFVAYPRNYAAIKFIDGMQLQLYLKEKEILIQLWNSLKPQPIFFNSVNCSSQNNNSQQSDDNNQNLETKKQFKYCVFSKALSFILSLIVDQLSNDDYKQIYQNYVTQIMKEQNQNNHQTAQQQSSFIPYYHSKYYLERDDRWELRKIIQKLKEIKKSNKKYTKDLEIKSLGLAQIKLSQNVSQNYCSINKFDSSKSSSVDQINDIENQRIREILAMKLKLTPINKWELNFLGQK